MAALSPRVKDLRDLDDWQRWANAGRQEELCQRVERLIEVEDLAVAAQRLREAQAEWKQVAIGAARPVAGAVDPLQGGVRRGAREVRRALRPGGRDAGGQPGPQRGAVRQGGSPVRVHGLDPDGRGDQGAPGRLEGSRASAATAGEGAVGTVPCGVRRLLHQAPGGPAHRKDEWAANLAKKEALCARAEAVAETTEWQQGIEEIKTRASRVEGDRPGSQDACRGRLAAASDRPATGSSSGTSSATRRLCRRWSRTPRR